MSYTLKELLEKNAGRTAATVGGMIPGTLGAGGGLGAEKGKTGKTWLGALGGQMAGGALAGALTRNPNKFVRNALMSASAGGGAGAYLAHGENSKGKKKMKKTGSANLFAEAFEKEAGKGDFMKKLHGLAAKRGTKNIPSMKDSVNKLKNSVNDFKNEGARLKDVAKKSNRTIAAVGTLGIGGAGTAAYMSRDKKPASLQKVAFNPIEAYKKRQAIKAIIKRMKDKKSYGAHKKWGKGRDLDRAKSIRSDMKKDLKL